jgi:predicted nucleic acid-binding protein
MLTIDANVWVAAADRNDEFYMVSRTFLLAVARQQLRIYLPAFAHIEIACALARRRRNAAAGERLANALLVSASVVHVALDLPFLAYAMRVGTRDFLRGADALYVATAELNHARLVSWDEELAQRAAAITPNNWLAANS